MADRVPISTEGTNPVEPLIAALGADVESTRLKAALAIGSAPEPGLLDILIERCAIEPDFYVRDMLTWALTRFPSEITVPRLLAELRRARSGPEPGLAHAVQDQERPRMARDHAIPAARLRRRGRPERMACGRRPRARRGRRGPGRGIGRAVRSRRPDVQLSLSRALLALGEEVVGPVLRKAMTSETRVVHAHASATERLLSEPGRRAPSVTVNQGEADIRARQAARSWNSTGNFIRFVSNRFAGISLQASSVTGTPENVLPARQLS